MSQLAAQPHIKRVMEQRHDRDFWLPEFHQTMVEVLGQEWPELIIEKWERNGIGETRYVESKTYRAI